jgi:hypothetical protein
MYFAVLVYTALARRTFNMSTIEDSELLTLKCSHKTINNDFQMNRLNKQTLLMVLKVTFLSLCGLCIIKNHHNKYSGVSYLPKLAPKNTLFISRN